MKKSLFFTAVFAVVLFSCSSDNETKPKPIGQDDDTIVEEPMLEEQQGETISVLTNNENPKVWKIVSAQVESSEGDSKSSLIDISTNFNIVDDEFIFSGGISTGSLEWRRGHDINLSAANPEETLLDYYRSPKPSSFSFMEESNSNLVSDDFEIKVLEDGTVQATLFSSVAAKGSSRPPGNLILTLEEKKPEDYREATTDLTFTPAFTFESSGVWAKAPGMIGSYSGNSFFLVDREDVYSLDNPNNPPEINHPERVIRFDLDNLSQNDFINYDPQDADFVSKQLHIVNNQLIAIGGRMISIYNFDISEDPSTVFYSENLVSEENNSPIYFTRFGMAVQDDSVYIIGGASVEGVPIQEARNIYEWDLNTETLTLFATLPERRFGARGTIVNNKMYVFGGSEKSFGDVGGTDTLYIIDMNNPNNIETRNLEQDLTMSFVQKFENLIIVAGYLFSRPEGQDSGPFTTDNYIGVFNTEDNSYKQLSHNLEVDVNKFNRIHQIALFNGKLYVLYGSREIPATLDNLTPINEWTIYEADIE